MQVDIYLPDDCRANLFRYYFRNIVYTLTNEVYRIIHCRPIVLQYHQHNCYALYAEY